MGFPSLYCRGHLVLAIFASSLIFSAQAQEDTEVCLSKSKCALISRVFTSLQLSLHVGQMQARAHFRCVGWRPEASVSRLWSLASGANNNW